MKNFFNTQIEADTPEGDAKLLALQLAVATELSNSPKIMEYLELQAHESMLDLMNQNALGVDSVKYHVLAATQTGMVDAYKHLFDLALNKETIEAQYIQLTRGNQQ